MTLSLLDQLEHAGAREIGAHDARDAEREVALALRTERSRSAWRVPAPPTISMVSWARAAASGRKRGAREGSAAERASSADAGDGGIVACASAIDSGFDDAIITNAATAAGLPLRDASLARGSLNAARPRWRSRTRWIDAARPARGFLAVRIRADVDAKQAAGLADLRLRPAPQRVGSARAPGNSARWRSSANAPSCTAKPPGGTVDRRASLGSGAGRGHAGPTAATGGSGAARRDDGLRRRRMIDSTSTSPLPLLRDAEPVRGRVRQIDDAAVQERAAVVDAHDHALAGRDVGDARVRRQRQRRVRGGHRVHVVDLARSTSSGRGTCARTTTRRRARGRSCSASPARSRGRAPCRAIGEAMQRLERGHGVGNVVEIRRAGCRRGRRPCSTWATAARTKGSASTPAATRRGRRRDGRRRRLHRRRARAAGQQKGDGQ